MCSAEERRVADLHQRVVHLEVEDVPHPATGELVEHARLGQGRERAAVAVRAGEQHPGRFQQQPAGGEVHGRHRALLEEVDVVPAEAEVVVARRSTPPCRRAWPGWS